jgi:hypothetical protein
MKFLILPAVKSRLGENLNRNNAPKSRACRWIIRNPSDGKISPELYKTG